MSRVRAGAEVIIENGTLPVAVIHAPIPSRRSISECIALAKKHEEESGEAPCSTLISHRMSKRSSAIARLGIRLRGNEPVGLILDSSVVIAAERRGHSVRQILEQLQVIHGEVEIGLSVVTIAELIHGVYRAQADSHRQRRLAFR